MCVRCAFCTSTSGDCPDTVTLSSIDPTLRSTLIGTVVLPGSSTPSRTTFANPVRMNVMV